MKSRKLTVTEIVRNFSEYINRIIYKHESFVLFKGKKPVAEIKPVPVGILFGELPEIISNLPELSDKESSDFLSDIKESRKINEKLRDPWGS